MFMIEPKNPEVPVKDERSTPVTLVIDNPPTLRSDFAKLSFGALPITFEYEGRKIKIDYYKKSN